MVSFLVLVARRGVKQLIVHFLLDYLLVIRFLFERCDTFQLRRDVLILLCFIEGRTLVL